MSNAQDDPDKGEFSNVGRDGWDWQCVFWFVLLVIASYGPIVALLRGCGR